MIRKGSGRDPIEVHPSIFLEGASSITKIQDYRCSNQVRPEHKFRALQICKPARGEHTIGLFIPYGHMAAERVCCRRGNE